MSHLFPRDVGIVLINTAHALECRILWNGYSRLLKDRFQTQEETEDTNVIE